MLSQRVRSLLANAGRRIGQHYGFSDQQSAYLGKGDGLGAIIATEAAYPRSVWCYRDTTEGRRIFTAVLGDGCGVPYENNPAFEGKPVTLAFPPASTILTVIGSTGFEATQYTGGVTLIEQKIADASFVQQNRLMPLFIAPNTGMSVYVNAAPYIRPSNGDWRFFGGDTVLLTAPSSGQHQMAVVVINTETEALEIVTNTAITGSNKDDFGYDTIDAMTFSPEHLICGAVHLYGGQTDVGESDIYRAIDGRVLWHPSEAFYRFYRASATTTDTTVTTLASTAVGVGQIVTIRGIVTALRDDASEGVGGSFLAVGRRGTSGDVALVGSVDVSVKEDSSGSPSFTVDADSATQTIRVRVTGETSKTFVWRTQYEVLPS